MAAILSMYHPDLKATGETTEEAFRGVYQFRGWKLQSSADDFAGKQLGKSVGSLEDDLTQDELFQVAIAAGYTGNKVTKAKLVAEIKRLVPGGDAPAVLSVVGEDDVILPNGEQVTAAEAERRRLAAESDTPSDS